MKYLAKVTDIIGMLLAVFTGISFIPAVRMYYDIDIYADGDSAFMLVYGLLLGSCYGFFTSLFYKRKDPDMPVRQWPLGRLIAWPLLLLSFGIYKLIGDAYGI